MKIIIGLIFSLFCFNLAYGQSIAFPGPGAAPPGGVTPIGVPISIGTASGIIGSVSSATITTGANIVLGDLVVIAVDMQAGNNVTVSSISDGTNSYTLAQTAYRIGGSGVELWYKTNAAAVSSGATITINFTGAAGAGSQWTASGIRITGILTSAALDQAPAGVTGINSTLTNTTSTLAKFNEIAIGFSFNGTSTVYSGATNFTNINKLATGTNGDSALDYWIVSSTTAVAFSPVWTLSGGMGVLVTTFKGN